MSMKVFKNYSEKLKKEKAERDRRNSKETFFERINSDRRFIDENWRDVTR